MESGWHGSAEVKTYRSTQGGVVGAVEVVLMVVTFNSRGIGGYLKPHVFLKTSEEHWAGILHPVTLTEVLPPVDINYGIKRKPAPTQMREPY